MIVTRLVITEWEKLVGHHLVFDDDVVGEVKVKQGFEQLVIGKDVRAIEIIQVRFLFLCELLISLLKLLKSLPKNAKNRRFQGVFHYASELRLGQLFINDLEHFLDKLLCFFILLIALIVYTTCFVIHSVHWPWDLTLLLNYALSLVEQHILVLVTFLIEQRLPKFATKLLFITFELQAHVQAFYVCFLFIISTFLCQITVLSFFESRCRTVIDKYWNFTVDCPWFRVFRQVSLDFSLLLVNLIFDLWMTSGKGEKF